jgi:lantibiotic modifying enzyme
MLNFMNTTTSASPSLNKAYKKQFTAIAKALVQSWKQQEEKPTGVLAGYPGEILFVLCYAQITGNQAYYNLGHTLLQSQLNSLNEHVLLHTHCSGLAGWGWTFLHLKENELLEDNVNELLLPIDAYLGKQLVADMQKGNWDFLHGATGVALYFLKRRKYTSAADAILHWFINVLEEKAIKTESGIKWAAIRGKEKEIIFNISLSHGMSAIVAFLAKTFSSGILTTKVKGMMQGAIQYILQ